VDHLRGLENMFSGVTQQIKEKISQCDLKSHPYTWLEIEKFLPHELYNLVIENKIPSSSMYSLQERGRVSPDYSPGRVVVDLKPNMPFLPENIRSFWEDMSIWLHYSLRNVLLDYFKIDKERVVVDCLYARDSHGFYLRPHTDTNKKVLTALLYIPGTTTPNGIGTTIFIPKDRSFTCGKGLHHDFSKFDVYKTITYEPNKLFCFLKSNNSFHGLQPIEHHVERDLIIFDIQLKNV